MPAAFGYSNYSRAMVFGRISSSSPQLPRPGARPGRRAGGRGAGDLGPYELSRGSRRFRGLRGIWSYPERRLCRIRRSARAHRTRGRATRSTDTAATSLPIRLGAIESAYLRPRYVGFMEFQDEAGVMLHEALFAGESARIVLPQLDRLYRASRHRFEREES